ncbi:MAG: ATP-dependent DNA helicase [Woeseia sp.]
MLDLSEFFGPDSPLKGALPGFQPREGQAWMAQAVADTLDGSSHLVVEAGTGTGKTFAYLLPALQSGRKTIISTGTKALQDQLYHRDLPLMAKACGRPVTTALLKGRANYLCPQRLDTVAEHAGASSLSGDLRAVHRWRHETTNGDRAELNEVEEDSAVWPLVTSTVENCLGSKCPLYNECYVVKARRAAQEADLVVVNHHLLLADLALKEEGFIEFLPGAEAIILDEAHQIPDLAARFFGVSLSSRELERFFDELRGETLSMSQPELQRRLDKAHTALKRLRAEAPRQEGRHELDAVLSELAAPLGNLYTALIDLQNAVAEIADTSIEIDKMNEQLLGVIAKLAQLAGEDSWDGFRWIDVGARGIRLHLTPLDVADTLAGLINANHQAWIFTSATLAVGDDFSHFANRMGLGAVPGLSFPSPYALADHGMVYLPPGLPEPSDPQHTASVLTAVLPLLTMTSGGMFCLFTSHRALSAARKWLGSRKKKLDGRPLLVQGDAPRDDLLRRFRRHGNAVLLGTGSFWEGVDVRGQALTVVAIDKLPFASPADPLMMARLEYIRRQGGNGFTEHQLPQAVLALKQGAGRLLRDQNDFGVVVLCDPRVKTKNYGSTFLKCLEPMTWTETLSDVEEFLSTHETRAKTAVGEQ